MGGVFLNIIYDKIVADKYRNEFDKIRKIMRNDDIKEIGTTIPFILSSDFMYSFEKDLPNGKTFSDQLKICPYEMQWYAEYLYSKRLNYIQSSSFFFTIHLQAQYRIMQLLGYDEDIFARDYLGLCMNKGHVKSIRFKSSFIGVNIIRNIIKLYHILTGGRKYDRNIIDKIAWWIPVRKWRDAFRNRFR